MKTLHVKVTREMIDQARSQVCYDNVCTHCMLALAFHAAGFPQAQVFATTAWLIGGPKYCADTQLSGYAVQQRRRFDENKPIQPFAFRVKVSEKVMKARAPSVNSVTSC